MEAGWHGPSQIEASSKPSRASLDEVLKREMSWNLLDYFQTGFELRLVAELAAVDALLADDAADRLDKREFWRPVK